MSVAGLILSAGESRRIGSPKALLQYRGRAFLDQLLDLFLELCSPVVVVLGAHSGQIRAAIRPREGALFVDNPDYRLGQLCSMQCGLRAIPPDREGVLFTLVDHPSVERSTLGALLAPPHPLLAIPRFQGRRGHPVFLARELVPEFLALPPGGQAREVVHRHAAEIRSVDVDDPGILTDIDDAAAYQRLVESAS